MLLRKNYFEHDYDCINLISLKIIFIRKNHFEHDYDYIDLISLNNFVFFVLQIAASFFTIEVTIRVGGSWIGSLRRTRDK